MFDAKVASTLCPGGPVKYKICPNSGVTNIFILQYVVPHVASRFSERVALVLGTALLWYIFSENSEDVPEAIRSRVLSRYSLVRVLDQNINPVLKIPLVVWGNEGEVYMDEQVFLENSPPAAENNNGHEGPNQNGGNGGNGGGSGQALAAADSRPTGRLLTFNTAIL